MEKIKERKKQAWDNMIYSAQRLDLLIVSFCGAGIYVCLEIIKYSAVNKLQCGLLIKFCGFAFLLGVALNFLSQHYGLKANRNDYLMSDAMLDAEDIKLNDIKKNLLIIEIKKYDDISEKYSNLTNKFNSYSMYALFAGLTLMLLYFFTTF
jgi:hypothetical protein